MTISNVYLVRHERDLDDGSVESKMIGVYASEAEADAAVARSLLLPGFRDYPDDFTVIEIELGKDHWVEGFSDW